MDKWISINSSPIQNEQGSITLHGDGSIWNKVWSNVLNSGRYDLHSSIDTPVGWNEWTEAKMSLFPMWEMHNRVF